MIHQSIYTFNPLFFDSFSQAASLVIQQTMSDIEEQPEKWFCTHEFTMYETIVSLYSDKVIKQGPGLKHELNIYQRLGKHPYIVSCHGREQGNLILEKIGKGLKLNEYALYFYGKNRIPPLPVSKALELMVQVTSAVVHMHSKGIIHHDLVGPNVVVEFDESEMTPDEKSIDPTNPLPRYPKRLVIIDMGAAEVLDENGRGDPNKRWKGHPSTAPEQCTDENISRAFDVYGLGEILRTIAQMTLDTGLDWKHRYNALNYIVFKLFKGCNAQNPEERPIAQNVLKALQEIQNFEPEIWSDIDQLLQKKLKNDIP